MALQLSTSVRTNRVAQVQATVGGLAWAASTPYALNQFVYNGANNYQVTTAGTSASSGGPTGTGAGITDGTVTWKFVQPTLKIFSGSVPANAAASDPAGLLATINLPSQFLTSSAGATTIAGTWSVAASAGGTAASFRMYDGSTAVVCHLQGNVTTDLVLNNTNIASGQTVSVTSFTITDGNA